MIKAAIYIHRNLSPLYFRNGTERKSTLPTLLFIFHLGKVSLFSIIINHMTFSFFLFFPKP